MSILRSIKMICANIDSNNNKFWNGELHDSGEFFVHYGRVGTAGQKEGPFSGGDKAFSKKIAEKQKKGYAEFSGISSGNVQAPVVKSDVATIAKRQIRFSSVQLEKLIERLVQSNVHTITSNTKIEYDEKTGLFSTPMGIVTLDAINQARTLLAEIKKKIRSEPKDLVNQYLKIIPHNIGMKKLSIGLIFPDQNAFEKELNILDSLESSFNQATSNVLKEAQDDVEEKIFDLTLETLSDQKEIDRINLWYKNSMKSMHGYDKVKVKNIFSVSLNQMNKAFESGKLLGGIQEVFHGTSEANLLSIMKSGLKCSPPSTAYVVGKNFGCGVYGAIHSSKALGYTFGKWGGRTSSSGWLFVCEFAMGKTFFPKHERGNPPKGFDSTWAKADRTGLYHDELIVFSDKQIKIKYLLECA